MAKVRRDGKGRTLRKGETYLKKRKLYSFSYQDALGNRKFLYAGDLPELREKEAELQRNKMDRLDMYVLAKENINYAFDRYIATKSELKSTTMSGYIYTYDRYVRPGFGKKRISDVHYSEVLMYYSGLLERGLSISVVESVHSLLHPTFQMAVRDNVIRNNPSDGAVAELKKKRRGDGEERFALTIEQQRAFLDFVDQPKYLRWRPMFIVMFGTGVRVGELIGLRWVDLDYEKGFVSINHNVTYYPRSTKGFKCEFELSLPKTAAGIRTIPMFDEVKNAFQMEKSNQAKLGYECVVELGGMSGFIFCNRFGNLHNPSSINREIARIVDSYNAAEIITAKREKREPLIIPKFSCHITRHTFCTRLCENETNIKVIQTIMGHKDIRTTMDIYAEVSERKKAEVFKGLNNENIF